MLKKPLLNCLFLLPAIFLIGCQSINKGRTALFRINSSYYQSWVVSENERGTDILLRVTRVRKSVVFDTIVFRGVSLPVFTSAEKGVVILKGILPIGQSRIRVSNRVTGEPDQLIYRFKGDKKSYPLTNLERKETTNYPKRMQEN